MGRTPKHSSAAERQKAYRERLKLQNHQSAATGVEALTPPAKGSRKPPSRPARLVRMESDIRAMLAEYENWLESLPESLADTSQAELLSEAIEQLEIAAEAIGSIRPPRGYGRD
jgi:hypothetical protein